MPLTSFSSGQTISSSAVNANFGLCVLVDTSRTITVTHTWSASQTFSAGISLTGTLTMATAASKLVPGATSFSIRNTADSADNLIITDAGAATFRSTVGGITTLTATTLAGTLSTAAQTNITSVGALTSLTVNGLTALADTGSFAKIGAPLSVASAGAGDFVFAKNTSIRRANNADNATVRILTFGGGDDVLYLAADNSAVVFGTGTVSFGGTVKITATASKIVPGATSLSLRNNADSADNILISDAGAVTFRGALTGITSLTATSAVFDDYIKLVPDVGPVSPANGHMWVSSDGSSLKVYLAGAEKTVTVT